MVDSVLEEPLLDQNHDKLTDSQEDGSIQSFRIDTRPARRKGQFCRLSACQLSVVASILCLIVAVIVGVFVVGRSVAEKMLNRHQVQATSVHMQPVSACPQFANVGLDPNKTVIIAVSGLIDSHAIIDTRLTDGHATLFADVNALPNVDGSPNSNSQPDWQPVGFITLPNHHWTKGEKLAFNTSAPLHVTDADLLGRYTAHLMNTTSATWRLEGKVTITAKLWSIFKTSYRNLRLHNTVVIPGLGGHNITLHSFKLPGNNIGEVGGVLMRANSTLHNPSNIAIDMPPYMVECFVTTSKGLSRVGKISVPALRLRQGDNNMTVHGYLNPNAETSSLLTDWYSRFLQSENVYIRVKHGVSPNKFVSEWMKKILYHMEFKMPMRAMDMDKQIVTSVGVDQVRVEFSETGVPLVSALVASTFKDPFGFPIQMQQVGVDIYVQQAMGGGTNGPASTGGTGPLARLFVPPVPASSTMGAETFTVDFGKAVVTVLDQPRFDDFMTLILKQPLVTVMVTVTSNMTFYSALHTCTVNGFNVGDVIASVHGLDNFRPTVIRNGKVYQANGTTKDTFMAVTDVTLTNPPKTPTVVMGKMKVNLTYMCLNPDAKPEVTTTALTVPATKVQPRAVLFGEAYMDNVWTTAGESTFRSSCYFQVTELNRACVQEFFARFMSSDDGIQMGMDGLGKDSTDIHVLQPVMDGLHLMVDVAAPHYRMIVNCTVTVKVFSTHQQVMSSITVFNPLPIPLLYPAFNVDVVDPNGAVMYTLVYPNSVQKDPLVCMPGTSEVSVHMFIGNFHWEVVKDAIGILKTKKIKVSLTGDFTWFIPPKFSTISGYKEEDLDLLVVIEPW